MAFSYDPALPTAISRIRFAVSDKVSPGYFPDETYTAVLAINAGDEGAARRQIAAALAVEFAQQPDSVSDAGSAVRWSERVAQWRLIAAGGEVAGPSASKAAVGTTLRGKPRPDYTLAGGDVEDAE